MDMIIIFFETDNELFKIFSFIKKENINNNIANL